MDERDIRTVILGEDDSDQEGKPPAHSLSPQQQGILDKVDAGMNLFLTGGGGVGKSHVIHSVVAGSRARGKTVAVTASTGVAADQIKGRTLHAQLGLGLAKDPLPKLIKRALGNRKLVKSWRKLDLLVIDEVSMIDPDFFTTADHVARAVRGDLTKPFGGVQLLLSGDFFQLPPVLPRTRDPRLASFCFQTESWTGAVHEVVELTHVFRQHGDSAFIDLLHRVRRGETTLVDIELLLTRLNAPLDAKFDGIEPTRMHARRVNVDEINSASLQALTGAESAIFTANVSWDVDTPRRGHARGSDTARSAKVQALRKAADAITRNVPAKEEVELRVGAQVMLLANLNVELGLVNGSRGVVVRFTKSLQTQHTVPVVRFRDREMAVERYSWEHTVEDAGTVCYRQTPLTLAWAVTIHKAQGLSLDCVELSLDRSVFEKGQAYVALSRVRSLAGLRLLGLTPSAIAAHPVVKQYYAQLAGVVPSVAEVVETDEVPEEASFFFEPMDAAAIFETKRRR